MERALSVSCAFSQIANTELSLLNCQDRVIAGEVQCFSPTRVRLNDTGVWGGFAAISGIPSSGF